jgi:outer membrane lipoprotein carrier protein
MSKLKLLLSFLLLNSILFAKIVLPDNFQANFKQMITNTKGKVIHYKGKVYFSEHTVFKWAYLEPTQKEVCTNGDELLVVDHDLEQVSSYYISKGLDISKVLEKATLHSKNIYVASYENKKYTIQLDHKKRLQSIAYFDDLDNKVQILFTGMKYAKGNLKKKTMQCHFPKDYDMIRG